jgi:hypothetical protein
MEAYFTMVLLNNSVSTSTIDVFSTHFSNFTTMMLMLMVHTHKRILEG